MEFIPENGGGAGVRLRKEHEEEGVRERQNRRMAGPRTGVTHGPERCLVSREGRTYCSACFLIQLTLLNHGPGKWWRWKTMPSGRSRSAERSVVKRPWRRPQPGLPLTRGNDSVTAADVEFIPEDGGGAGVRLRRSGL